MSRSAAAPHAALGLALLVAASLPARAQLTLLRDDDAFRAARAIARGSVLTPQDIVGGDSRQAPVGWVARRVIRSGEILRAPAIAPKPVITKGSSIQADFIGPGVRITRAAVAQADGAVGDTLFVRIDRRRNIPAVVRDSATVTLLTTIRR